MMSRGIALAMGAAALGASMTACSFGAEEANSSERVRVAFELLDVTASAADPSRRQTVEVVAHVDGDHLTNVETRTAPAGTRLASTTTRTSADGQQLRLLSFTDCQSESYPPPAGGSTIDALVRDTIGSWEDFERYGFTFDGQWWTRTDQDLIYRQREQAGDLEMLSSGSKKLVTVVSKRSFERGYSVKDFTISLPDKCHDELA